MKQRVFLQSGSLCCSNTVFEENWFFKSTVERRAGLGSTGMINASGTKHNAALVVRGCVVCSAFHCSFSLPSLPGRGLIVQGGKNTP